MENKLIELKVGSSNCIFATQYNRDDDIIEKRVIGENAKFPHNSNDCLLPCYLGNGIPTVVKKDGLNFRFSEGNPNIKSLFWKTSLTGQEYLFKTFPLVQTITPNEVSVFGETEVTLTGAGFMQSSIGNSIKVYIDDNENDCKVTNIKNGEVKCLTSPISANLDTKMGLATPNFLGGPGLRYRKYDVSGTNLKCYARIAANNFPDGADSAVFQDSDSVVLEGSTKSYKGNDYLEYLNGIFLAPKTTDYRFFVTGSSKVTLYIDSNKVESYYSDFRDYTTNTSQISGWINLTAGNHVLRAFHCKEGNSADYFSFGVEQKEGGARRELFSNDITNQKQKPANKENQVGLTKKSKKKTAI